MLALKLPNLSPKLLDSGGGARVAAASLNGIVSEFCVKRDAADHCRSEQHVRRGHRSPLRPVADSRFRVPAVVRPNARPLQFKRECWPAARPSARLFNDLPY